MTFEVFAEDTAVGILKVNGKGNFLPGWFRQEKAMGFQCMLGSKLCGQETPWLQIHPLLQHLASTPSMIVLQAFCKVKDRLPRPNKVLSVSISRSYRFQSQAWQAAL